jgi:structure-specific recognition protein 1
MGVFSCFYLILSGKNLRIMNLGDDQGTSGGVSDILLDTENAGDPYIERIKNQAGDEESDEEVDFLLFACSLVLTH